MSNQNGTSLLEVLFAISFFGIISAGILPGFLYQFQEVTRNDHRSNAVGLAQELLDDLRSQDTASMPTSGTVGPTSYPRGNYNYDAEITYCADSSLCPSVDTKHITVTISYDGRRYYEVETVFTALL